MQLTISSDLRYQRLSAAYGQAKKMAGQSDGVIVGSAIVKLCGQYGVECVPYVKEYVKAMKDAVREA